MTMEKRYSRKSFCQPMFSILMLSIVCMKVVMRNASRIPLLLASIGFSLVCSAETVVTVYKVTPEGNGPEIGTVVLSQTDQGVMFRPDLRDLIPGEHGFHVHENPSCEPMEVKGRPVPALAAGGHYDPDNTRRHEGPNGTGHKGDLPKLMVNDKSMATEAVTAPRLTLAELSGRSLMIHEKGDNYSDRPPMGGGGARIACGVIN